MAVYLQTVVWLPLHACPSPVLSWADTASCEDEDYWDSIMEASNAGPVG